MKEVEDQCRFCACCGIATKDIVLMHDRLIRQGELPSSDSMEAYKQGWKDCYKETSTMLNKASGNHALLTTRELMK